MPAGTAPTAGPGPGPQTRLVVFRHWPHGRARHQRCGRARSSELFRLARAGLSMRRRRAVCQARCVRCGQSRHPARAPRRGPRLESPAQARRAARRLGPASGLALGQIALVIMDCCAPSLCPRAPYLGRCAARGGAVSGLLLETPGRQSRPVRWVCGDCNVVQGLDDPRSRDRCVSRIVGVLVSMLTNRKQQNS